MAKNKMTDRDIVRSIIYIRNHLAEYYDDEGRIDRDRLVNDLDKLKDGMKKEGNDE